MHWLRNCRRNKAISEDGPMKQMVLDANYERAEEIASELTHALGEIALNGEDMADVVLGVSMFWQIIFQFADHEMNGGSESIH